MVTLYLVRHGETLWNKEGRLQGSLDSPLTDEGRSQGKALGEYLKDEKFDKIYSSPMTRALETAILASKRDEDEIERVPLLKEMSFGEMEGEKKVTFEKKYPKSYNALWNQPLEYDPSEYNGETFSSMEDRVREGLAEIVSRCSSGDKIMVVSHGMTLKSIFSYINGETLERYWETPVPKNTSYSIVKYDIKSNKYSVEEFSKVDHLKVD